MAPEEDFLQSGFHTYSHVEMEVLLNVIVSAERKAAQQHDDQAGCNYENHLSSYHCEEIHRKKSAAEQPA